MNRFATVIATALGALALSPALPAHAQATELRWPPPALASPITLTLGTGYTSNTLDNTKDYIIKLPNAQKVGSTVIKGGRNVVIKGGYITVPAGDPVQRALYIKDSVGTVHIEGVLIDNPNHTEFDGIAIAAPNAIVQIQNVRCLGLEGTAATFHSDLVQPWGGVKHLRVDYFTGTSGYQGFQIPIDQGPIVSTELRNVNVSYQIPAGQPAGYLLWLTTGSSSGNTYPITLANFYVGKRPLYPTAGKGAVWLSTIVPAGFQATQVGTKITWPSLPTITGYAREGAPTGGDFVPAGVAGLGYVSPGYRS